MGRASRASILLLGLLLVNTLGVSVLAGYALSSQKAEADRNRREAERLALGALGEDLNNALYQAMLHPVLMLRTLYRQGAPEVELRQVVLAHDFVRSLFVLDQDQRLKQSWPAADVRVGAFLQKEIVPHIRSAGSGRYPVSYELRSLVDLEAAAPRLYVFQAIGAGNDTGPVDRSSASSEWVVVGSDIGRIAAKLVQPRLDRFGRDNGFEVRLRSPDEPVGAGTISWSLTSVLDGWRLEMRVPSNPSLFLDPTQWPTLGAAIGLLIAIALIGVAILAELRRQQALVELRNRFVENVSHELRTPLSLIRMYAETLFLRRVVDPGKQHEYYAVILGESERLSRMIGDVLDFSRLRQGYEVYRLTHGDLGATVSEIVETYDAEWRRRGAEVRAEIAPVAGAVAHDPQGISQVVLNLVDNAIRHGDGGGAIVVRLVDRGGGTELSVADLGGGLDRSAQSRLLRSMVSGDMFEEAAGSGLGLSLVKRICDSHGARINLSSTNGTRGLTVSIWFPLGEIAK